MASRQSPSTIVHPFYGLKKRCASNRRYAVAYVTVMHSSWDQKTQSFVQHNPPKPVMVVEKRTDNLDTARYVFNKLYGHRPIIWDLVTGEVVKEGQH